MKKLEDQVYLAKDLFNKGELSESEERLLSIYNKNNIVDLESVILLDGLYLLSEIYIKKEDWEKVLFYGKLLLKNKGYKILDILYNVMISNYFLGNDIYKKYLEILEKKLYNNKKTQDFKEKINLEGDIIYDQLLIDKSGNSKLIIVLILTLKCNQKCVFCNVNKGNTFITPTRIKNNLLKILDKYKGIDNKTVQIALSGGEPTIHPDFWNIVDMIYIYADFLEIQSNGVFFATTKNKKELSKRNNNMKLTFLLSFHSHIEEIYNKITDTKNQYDLAVKGIQNVISSGIKSKIEINIVINKYNINYFGDYLKFIKKHIYSFNKGNIDLNLIVSILKVEKEDEGHYELIVKYSDFIFMFIKNLDYIKSNGFEQLLEMNGGICDLPLCSINNDVFKVNEGFLLDNIPVTHTKIDKCNSCILNSKCPGILKSYINKFGEDEFTAL